MKIAAKHKCPALCFRLTEEFELDGHILPKDTMILANIYHLNRWAAGSWVNFQRCVQNCTSLIVNCKFNET